MLLPLWGLIILFFLAAVSSDWRKGLLVCIAVGFLQDPMRKLTVGEPVAFVVLVLVFIGLTGLLAMTRLSGFQLQGLFGRHQQLAVGVKLFSGYVCLESILTYLNSGSPIIAGLGMLSYLAPLPVLWLAYHYARQPLDIERFMAWYCSFSILAAIAIYLSWLGYDWPIFRQVGTGVAIYERTLGVYIEAHTGFLRTPENAAWHTGTGACFLILLAMNPKRRLLRIGSIPLLLLLVGAALLTGRRKVVMEVLAFLAFFGLLAFYFRHETLKRAIGAWAAGAVVFMAVLAVVFPGGEAAGLSPYFSRAQTVFGDVDDRLFGLGVATVLTGFNNAGLLGYGAGICAQGVQHFGGGAYCGAAEGGAGKIVMELGIVGLLLAALVVYGLSRQVWRIIAATQRGHPEFANLAMGLSAFILANAAIFIAASQIFGDPFVLFILGCATGFVLAIPKMALYQQWVVNSAAARVLPDSYRLKVAR